MKPIVVKSPTRVDLAGGTLDLWPLFNFVGGATTINIAIDIFTTATITPTENPRIFIESEDLRLQKSYANLDECLRDADPSLHLLQVQMKYWKPERGFQLKTSSQSPVGGGLGGSSSLTISLMTAFAEFCERPFASTHELVHAAHNIEAEVLNTPTGTQDYYPAASGGLNILTYNTDGIQQSIQSIKGTPLETHFLLVYTGRSHHSGLNNFEVLKGAVTKDKTTMKALFDLRQIADDLKQVLEKKSWSDLSGIFRREFAARVLLSPAFTCPEIETLHGLALNSGAQAVKICGAGGGGCVMLWVPPAEQERVSAECLKAGFKVLGAKPVNPLP